MEVFNIEYVRPYVTGLAGALKSVSDNVGHVFYQDEFQSTAEYLEELGASGLVASVYLTYTVDDWRTSSSAAGTGKVDVSYEFVALQDGEKINWDRILVTGPVVTIPEWNEAQVSLQDFWLMFDSADLAAQTASGYLKNVLGDSLESKGVKVWTLDRPKSA